MPLTILSSGLGLLGSIVNTQQVNQNNKELTQMTNANNRALVQMQNDAAKAESELAYKRNSAPNQVNLLMQAGMSRAGAINALNGAGGYTPAPVNTAQETAPQMQTADLSGFANIAQAINAKKQLKLQEQVNGDAVDYGRDKKYLKSIYDKINNRGEWDSSTNYMPTIDDVYSILNEDERKAMTNPLVREQVQQYLDGSFRNRKDNHDISMFPYATHAAEYERDMRNLDRELRNAVQAGEISAQQRERAARESKAILDKLYTDTSYDALMDMPADLRQKYYETRALLEWLSHAGEMTSEKVINKLRTIIGL